MKKCPTNLGYEYKIKEIKVSSYSLENFAVNQGLASLYSSHSPELEAALRELSREVSALLSHLTEKQRTLINLMLQGYSQTEMASKLGITQSAVHKALYGAMDYKSKAPAGGTIPKLRKLCATNTSIQRILLTIARLKLEEKDED